MENKFNIEYYALLARRIRKQDEDAFTELYHATYNNLYRYAYYFLKDAYLAQDALHEIYIIVYRSISSLKEDRLLYPWMKQITYHVCCDFQKKDASVAEHEKPASLWNEEMVSVIDNSDYFQPVWEKNFREQIHKYLSELHPQTRQAFLLRYENELKLEEIADFLGCSLSTVKRAIRKARKHLQSKFHIT